jgi:hypothetical protein
MRDLNLKFIFYLTVIIDRMINIHNIRTARNLVGGQCPPYNSTILCLVRLTVGEPDG